METDRASNNGSGLQRARPLHGRTSGPTRRSTKGQWTAEEDEILRMAVHRFKGKNWKKIAECFRDRTDVQCLHRWQKVLNPDLVKGPWSKEEDEKIIELVNKYGPKKWSTIAQHLPGRIGKQCRERWHNHLNPNINKEAWTQDEELILIRAHQIYGNKWAELTKFLPGRTDNAIKNHWNSSVKKKLDMYMASGLLAQIQDIPLVIHPNHAAASSSSKVKQSSDDDSDVKDGVEVEEASECSQGSAIASVSQSTNNAISLPTGDCRGTEDVTLLPCSDDYRPVFQEPVFAMPEVPCEQGGKFLVDHDFSLDWGIFEEKDWQQSPNKLPDVSLLEIGQQSSGLFRPSSSGHDNHEAAPFLQEPCIASGVAACILDMVSSTDNGNIIADSDCRMVYPEADLGGCCPSEINISNMGHHASTFQIPQEGTSASESCLMPSEMAGNSFSQQTLHFPTQLPLADGSLAFSSDQNLYSYSCENAENELIPLSSLDDFIDPKESDCTPSEDDDSIETMDSRKLVPANDFISAASNDLRCCSSVEKDTKMDVKDSGALCYEPPRFPSLDIPFFSCDLIQPSTDMHQEYSPLGIRQLMLSSLTPFKLWDSPRRDSSPDAVLKSAAKTFTSTPSILKKRHRDLVSPLSEKRGEKKLGSCLRKEAFSNLANDFSRLEVMFDECADKKGPLVASSPNQRHSEVFLTNKENVFPACTHAENQGEDRTTISENTMSEEAGNVSEHLTKITEETPVTDVQTNDGGNVVETGVEISGILAEHDMNDLLFSSPDRFGVKTDQSISLASKYSRQLDAASKIGISLPASESCVSLLCSPRLSACKDGTNLVISTSLQTSTTPSAKKVENSGKGVAPENNNIFVDTPFRRSIESPSAWKSPWFIDSFVPGPRVDTDITIEDIGYFLSPGERSFDAIGLMKQLGEQTAGTFADAQEVLGNETPESLMKAKCGTLANADKENHCSSNIRVQEHRSILASNAMRERRTLDFSECETPRSEKESRRYSSSVSFSSPSSYLLKGCR